MSEFKSKVKDDEVYKTFRRIFRGVQENADLNKISREAAFLHSSRKSRQLHELKGSPAKVQDALFQELSNRSRLIELKVMVMSNLDLLESTISRTKKHINDQYADELKEISTTVSGRNAVVAAIFATAQDYANSVSTVSNQLELYIKDIDAAGYTLSNVRELLKLQLGPRTEVM